VVQDHTTVLRRTCRQPPPVGRRFSGDVLADDPESSREHAEVLRAQGCAVPPRCRIFGDEHETWRDTFHFLYMQCSPGLIAHVAWWHYLYTADEQVLPQT